MLGRRRHWDRYRQIAEVLTRYGFKMIVDTLGMRYRRWGWFKKRRIMPSLDDWSDRICQALVELGPTYIKLGQLASTRSDLLPARLVRALATLQDDVQAVTFDQVQKIVEAAWSQPYHTCLAYFDPTPLATASVGQVHSGRLADGREVVIKVRRPGIVAQSHADFAILRDLAQWAERHSDWGKQYQIRRLVDDLIKTLQAELDFGLEATNTQTARANLRRNPWAIVPEVIWELSREDVLVLTRIQGVKISDREQLKALGLCPGEVASHLIEALYQQVFEDGFFHADPHPGNVHVNAEGRVIWLDWGMVGTFSPAMKRRSVDLIMGLIQQRSDRVAESLIKLSQASSTVNEQELLTQVEILRHRYYDASLQDFAIGQALWDLLGLAQRFQIQIPSDYALLAKTAILADGLVRQLDPTASLVELSKPFASRMLMHQLDPRHWWPSFGEEIGRWTDLVLDFPEDLSGTLKTMSRGEIHMVMEHKNVERILSHWERLVNRIGLSFILGSIILGTAIVVHNGALDRLLHFDVGEYVFILALLLTLGMIIHTLRKGRL